MQTTAATASTLLTSRLEAAAAARRAVVTPTTPGVSATATAPNGPALSEPTASQPAGDPHLKGLLNDWGAEGSRYDLDRSGRVGMADLLLLLRRMGPPGAPPVPSPTSDGTGPQTKDQGTSPIQQLLADWGRSDSPWDLDHNGTVGMSDLVMLLAQMGQGHGQDAPGAPQAQVEDGIDPGHVEKLLADWGKEGSVYDLDHDGRVGMRDLLLLLGRLGSPGAPQVPPPQGAPGPADVASEAPSLLEQLLAAWGSGDRRFDLDADGTVGIRDLLRLLQSMREKREQGSTPAAWQPDRLAAPGHPGAGRGAAEHVAAALLQRAPTDADALRRAVLASNVSQQYRSLILGRASALLPRGRQVSMVG
jgi:Ca2+-binding EF-hand superfamily protein